MWLRDGKRNCVMKRDIQRRQTHIEDKLKFKNININ